MQHLFRQLTQPEKSGNNLSMMLFALVEVVMIVVGIVMANQLEEQKEIREVTERAEVLFEEVLRDLEADCWAAFSPLFVNRSNNRLSDVLFNPDRTLAEVQANAFSIYYMLRFESALHIDTQGYEALEKIHERLPEHLLKAYEQLDRLMDQNATIQEHNRRYQDVVYANMEHNIQNHPWWNKGTYSGVPDAEALAWMMGEECKAQTHLVVNSSAHLAGAAERFRTSAIQVYDEIKDILGDTTASPGYMSTHFYPTERTRRMLGTYVLQDSLHFGAAPYKNLSMEIIDDHLTAVYGNGDTLRLNRSGMADYSFPGPPLEDYMELDGKLVVGKWTIQKDWTYERVLD